MTFPFVVVVDRWRLDSFDCWWQDGSDEIGGADTLEGAWAIADAFNGEYVPDNDYPGSPFAYVVDGVKYRPVPLHPPAPYPVVSDDDDLPF